MDATTRVFQEHVPYSHDERVFRPDGSIRYLHTWAYPVRDDDGKLVRLVGVCQDITDRKLAEEAVLTLNADLERRVAERTRTIETSLRDLETFNAMASHDLRAPLAVIQAACALLLHPAAEPLPPQAWPTTSDASSRRSTRMTALVNDLLRLAQFGQASLTRADVDLTAWRTRWWRSCGAPRPSAGSTSTCKPGLRCSARRGAVRGPPIENLLGNAWKYSSRVAAGAHRGGRVSGRGRGAGVLRARQRRRLRHEGRAPALRPVRAPAQADRVRGDGRRPGGRARGSSSATAAASGPRASSGEARPSTSSFRRADPAARGRFPRPSGRGRRSRARASPRQRARRGRTPPPRSAPCRCRGGRRRWSRR